MKILLDHIKDVWADGDDKGYLYLIKWFADIVQQPGKKNPKIPILRSDFEGAIKNLIITFFSTYVVGPEYVVQVENPETLNGEFTLENARCILKIMDEVHGLKAKIINLIKSWSGTDKQRIRPLNHEAYQALSFFSTIMTSNEDIPEKMLRRSRKVHCFQLYKYSLEPNHTP